MSYRAPDHRGTSSAVSSVLHHQGTTYVETKQGSYVYHGDAGSFHEWDFRTQLRVRGKKEEFYSEAVSKVVDGLRGDAFIVAQEVGLEHLWNPGAIDPDSGTMIITLASTS